MIRLPNIFYPRSSQFFDSSGTEFRQQPTLKEEDFRDQVLYCSSIGVACSCDAKLLRTLRAEIQRASRVEYDTMYNRLPLTEPSPAFLESHAARLCSFPELVKHDGRTSGTVQGDACTNTRIRKATHLSCECYPSCSLGPKATGLVPCSCSNS